MKHLKWLIALVALLIVPLSITAAPAGAASCSASESTTSFSSGRLWFLAYAGFCTQDVSYLQYYTPGDGLGTGWFDGAYGQPYPYHYADTIDGPALWPNATQGDIHNYNTSVWYGGYPWCGGAVHPVSTFWSFRIRNASQGWPGTWGPWHQRTSGGYNINC